MEITKEYNKQTEKELDDAFDNREWEDITLYYEIGYVMFHNGVYTVLYTENEAIGEADTEQLVVTDNYALLYNGKRYELEIFGITI